MAKQDVVDINRVFSRGCGKGGGALLVFTHSTEWT